MRRGRANTRWRESQRLRLPFQTSLRGAVKPVGRNPGKELPSSEKYSPATEHRLAVFGDDDLGVVPQIVHDNLRADERNAEFAVCYARALIRAPLGAEEGTSLMR